MEMQVIIFRIIFFLVGSLVFTLLTSLFTTMINFQFFKLKIKKIFLYTLYFNISYFILLTLSYFFIPSVARVLNYYIGFALYGSMVGSVFWLIFTTLYLFKRNHNLLVKRPAQYLFLGIFSLIIGTSIYNFEKPIAINQFTIASDKIDRDYKVVQVTDIQYGSVSKQYMEEVMDLALEQKPDLIAMTGDLVDFNKYKKEDFEFFKNIDIPIYFERGNHEFYHQINRLQPILEEIPSFKILDNREAVFNNEIQLVGIDYSRSTNFYTEQLDRFKVDQNMFSILLFHEPKFVDYAAAKGYDLQLYGHVHGGQIWPITKLVDRIYNYSRGYFEVGNSVVYTSEGAGLWGPKMRLGSRSEIAVFNLKAI